MPKAIVCFLLLSLLPVAARAGDEPARGRLRWNDRWGFLENDTRSIDSVRRVAAPWTEVLLPHTWNAFDAVDQIPGYRRGAGWYRKVLTIPENRGARRTILEFEGANITTDVFANGQRAGGHVGGYVGFNVDLTPLLRTGENEVFVRVDNSYDPHIIPSQRADFFIYGGIFRDVWLNDLPPDRIGRVHVLTPRVTREEAETVAEVVVQGTAGVGARTAVVAEILDPAGAVAGRSETTLQAAAGDRRVRLLLPTVRRPRLWSPSDPSLYTMRISLRSDTGLLDRVEERFGYRFFEFKEHGPFLLNGERLLLRGTHRHEDYAGLGNAIPDSLHRRDIVSIKAMGANFVRLAHYPQDPEIYRACDELGLLVWDELPWCRGGVGDAEWKSHTRRLLREQIDRNRNHPSIILWSLGNEMDWVPEFPGGDDPDSLKTFFRELHEIAKGLDSSRPTAVRKFPPGTGICDVSSPSIWAGWYSGAYRDYEKRITEAREIHPRLLHVEYGGDSHVGRHTEAPVDGEGWTGSDGWPGPKPRKLKNVSVEGDWGESYIIDLFDWHLRVSESLDWLTGNAQWAFKDFGTPLRPENPIPYVNQKGLVDRNGVPKDAYYVFKSHWTVSPAFCRIVSPTWDERSGPPGVKRSVRVYSNCRTVELFVNGVSAGKRVRNPAAFPAAGLTWDLLFSGGENRLTAEGTGLAGEMVGDSVRFTYVQEHHGEPDHLVLSASPGTEGTVLITAVAVDHEGRRCLDYNKRIYFSSLESGKLLEHYGTPTRSSVIEMANGRARIEYLPVPGGRGVVEARTQELKGSYFILK